MSHSSGLGLSSSASVTGLMRSSWARTGAAAATAATATTTPATNRNDDQRMRA